MMSLNSNLEVESRLMLKSMIALGKKKKKICFLGMSLVITKGEKHRKNNMLWKQIHFWWNISQYFHKIWILSVGGGQQRAQHPVPWRLFCTCNSRGQVHTQLYKERPGRRVLVINKDSGLCLQPGISRRQRGSHYFCVAVWAEALAGELSFLSTHAISLSGPFLCSLQNPPAKTNTPLPGRPQSARS